MVNITENITAVRAQLPNTVTLVAVSKTKPVELIQEAYNSGQKIFGENKVQELAQKYEQLPKDIDWHMIGHLQSNKVKYIAPFVSLIHGIDSIKLLKEINKRALQNNRVIQGLLQVHIAEETSKFGFSFNEIKELLNSGALQEYPHVKIVGLMGMATNTSDDSQVKKEFQSLKRLYNDYTDFTVLSMGMSGDYQLAIDAGSNMVRIGSAIFGSRTIN